MDRNEAIQIILVTTKAYTLAERVTDEEQIKILQVNLSALEVLGCTNDELLTAFNTSPLVTQEWDK
jgi:hypothetical protein